MNNQDEILKKSLARELSGEGAHAASQNVFEGLDWKLAGRRPPGTPHSLFQILNHLLYWQDWVVQWLDGEAPPLPKRAAASWPGGESPTDKQEWERGQEFSQRPQLIRSPLAPSGPLRKGQKKNSAGNAAHYRFPQQLPHRASGDTSQDAWRLAASFRRPDLVTAYTGGARFFYRGPAYFCAF